MCQILKFKDISLKVTAFRGNLYPPDEFFYLISVICFRVENSDEEATSCKWLSEKNNTEYINKVI